MKMEGAKDLGTWRLREATWLVMSNLYYKIRGRDAMLQVRIIHLQASEFYCKLAGNR